MGKKHKPLKYSNIMNLKEYLNDEQISQMLLLIIEHTRNIDIDHLLDEIGKIIMIGDKKFSSIDIYKVKQFSNVFIKDKSFKIDTSAYSIKDKLILSDFLTKNDIENEYFDYFFNICLENVEKEKARLILGYFLKNYEEELKETKKLTTDNESLNVFYFLYNYTNIKTKESILKKKRIEFVDKYVKYFTKELFEIETGWDYYKEAQKFFLSHHRLFEIILGFLEKTDVEKLKRLISNLRNFRIRESKVDYEKDTKFFRHDIIVTPRNTVMNSELFNNNGFFKRTINFSEEKYLYVEKKVLLNKIGFCEIFDLFFYKYKQDVIENDKKCTDYYTVFKKYFSRGFSFSKAFKKFIDATKVFFKSKRLKGAYYELTLTELKKFHLKYEKTTAEIFSKIDYRHSNFKDIDEMNGHPHETFRGIQLNETEHGPPRKNVRDTKSREYINLYKESFIKEKSNLFYGSLRRQFLVFCKLVDEKNTEYDEYFDDKLDDLLSKCELVKSKKNEHYN